MDSTAKKSTDGHGLKNKLLSPSLVWTSFMAVNRPLLNKAVTDKCFGVNLSSIIDRRTTMLRC